MDSPNKPKYTYQFSYRHAFLVPFIVMLAGCIGCGIYPFGNQSFLRNDLYNQYMPFFQAFYDQIWQGQGLSYSDMLGMGSGYSALYGYYLASPMNWLVLLCPRTLIGEFITLLILVKMSLSGVTFAHYLKKRFGKENIGLLLFSSAYALSGFMAAYQWNVMWLDGVWLAPLVLLALENLVEKGTGVPYCALLAVSIITNFYLSIMLCIFLVLYFLVLIAWKPWCIKVRSGLLFGLYSLLAGGLSCCILLPVYFALSGTKFSQFNFPSTVKWYMNGLELLSRHCMNVSMKVQPDHWPNIYCGVAMFLLVPLFVFSNRISWKEKLPKLLLAAFILVSFSLNILDFIWHGMNYPDSLPGRQSYLYIWLILVMGYEAYLHLRYAKLRHILVAAVLSYGVVIANWIFTDVEGTNVWTYLFSMIFVTFYIALLLVQCFWKYPRVREKIRATKWKTLFQNRYFGAKVLLCVLVLVELSCNMYVTSIRTVNRTNYMKHFQDREGAVAHLKALDEGLYRTEVFDRLTKNDSMMWGVPTATIFSSTVNANVTDLYRKLGMGTTRVSYWYEGATPLVSALLGVKYMVGKDASMENDLYELIYSDESGYLYKNKYSAPMGYVLDDSIEDNWNTSGYHPVQLQNNLCHLLGINGELLAPIERGEVDERTYTITPEEDSYVYVYVGSNSISEIEMTLGETTKKFTQVSFDYLLDLGYIAAGETATLQVVKEDQKFGMFTPYQLNQDVLQEAIDVLNRETLDVTEHKAGYVKGNVTLEKGGQLVISIPMEKGWVLKVNGEETPIDTFKEAFMAVPLDAGTYDIELKFISPGVKTGLLVSTASLVVLVLCYFIETRDKKKAVQESNI